MLDEVCRVLALIGTSGSFATHRPVAATDLVLEVRDVGRIRLPVTPSTARRLREASRPARHGFKDQTRLDRRVRDTGEIPSSRISIDEPRWERALAPQLDRIRRDLGLPEGCRLTAQLHNMLVYAPGQFFVTHQDSEKTDNMIGTLVVNLPSRFTGGAMTIEHHGEKVVAGGSDRNLTLIAFYADCHHEVQAIRQGHRIVLTYNLMVSGSTTTGASPDQTAALARSLRDFFETPVPPRRNGDRGQGPSDRLIYLLDHQYTQRGLGWNRLKNSDAARAAALQAVAQQLDCEIHLALADVHETWACEDDGGYGSSWGWSGDEEQEDEPDSESSDTVTLTELIDSEVELRHWIGSGARPKARASGVRANELCYTKPSSELEPFESQHEGYMGNWGNTVDRWYHRAAVVIWPRERTFIIRAKESPAWAIAEVKKAINARDTAKALALAQRLLPIWAQATRTQDGNLLGATLAVCANLGDSDTAAALLQPFALTGVTAKTAPHVAELFERYGSEWCRALLEEWASEKKINELPAARMAWMGSALRALCRSLCTQSSSERRTLALQILSQQWTWLLGHLKQLGADTSAKEMTKELARLCQPILALIDCTRITKDLKLHRQILDFLSAHTAAAGPYVQLGVLRAAHARHRSDTLRSLGLKPAHAHCSRDLTRRLDVPARAADDWSISATVRCSCELCATLNRYLHAPKQVRLEWPLAQGQRAHIHGIVDAHDLPVRHTTRRTGRPFTLVLEKTAATFERDAAERQSWQKDLRWLMQTAGDF
ncbi:MAG: 2OG-Fe(II) oxygenase [Gammaproteobacteria bacterium]